MTRGTPAKLARAVRFHLSRAEGYRVFDAGTPVQLVGLADFADYIQTEIRKSAKRSLKKGERVVLAVLAGKARFFDIADIDPGHVPVDAAALWPWLREAPE